MIRRLRRRHRVLSLCAFTAAAVVLAVGVVERRPGVRAAPLPAPLAAFHPDAERWTWLLAERSGGDDDLRWHVMLFAEAGDTRPVGVHLRLDAPTLPPDVLVHWAPPGAEVAEAGTAAGAGASGLPDGARLLGAVSSGRSAQLGLPDAAADVAGRLIATSLAHGERLFEVPLEPGDGAAPASVPDAEADR